MQYDVTMFCIAFTLVCETNVRNLTSNQPKAKLTYLSQTHSVTFVIDRYFTYIYYTVSLSRDYIFLSVIDRSENDLSQLLGAGFEMFLFRLIL